MKRLYSVSYMLSTDSESITFYKSFSWGSFFHSLPLSQFEILHLLMGTFSYFFPIQNCITGEMVQCTFWFLERECADTLLHLKYLVAKGFAVSSIFLQGFQRYLMLPTDD